MFLDGAGPNRRSGRAHRTSIYDSDFNTNPAPGENVHTVGVDEYSVELKSLDPYPRTPDDPIAFEDYRATLLVGR